MYVALDKEGNRIYADDGIRYEECICPYCDMPVIHKMGKVRLKHFAHKTNPCPYDKEKDHLSEWHRRMQSYFPKEEREFLFIDSKTGEKHIADVFIKDANTVIEFQYSHIDEQEFIKRTIFHLNNGRRIVWVFNESTGTENKSKFKPDDCAWESFPYYDKCFKWLYKRRSFLKQGPNISKYHLYYSVCIYTGLEGDLLHRIVAEHCDYEYVTISLHIIKIDNSINIEEFFIPERYWQEQEPYSSIIDKYRIKTSVQQN